MELGNGKVAVVTGAASGIGLALADAFAAAGCALVLADVEADALEAAEQRIAATGVDTLSVVTDVSKREQVEALAAQTLERFGHVNVLCNNAGVAGGGDPWFGGVESWEWVIGVNFWGVVHGVRTFLPHLIASGSAHVVNTASIAGLYPGFSPAYDASKHAVVALTEGLHNAMTTAGLPVGVSCLCPGWIRTKIVDATRNWPSELRRRAGDRRRRRGRAQARAAGGRRGDATGGRRRPGDQRRSREPVLGVPEPRVPGGRRRALPPHRRSARPGARAASRCRACRPASRSSPR